MTPQTVAIDFDAVIHPYKQWDGPDARGGAPIPGTNEALRDLRAAGYRILVYSTRPRTHVAAYLAAHGLLDLVDEVMDGKPMYVAFFDDRAHNVPANEAYGLFRSVRKFLGHVEEEVEV